MGYDHNRARIETSLARAHRALVDAKNAADISGDNGLYLDLQMLEVEITRLAEHVLKGRSRQRILRHPKVGTPDPRGA